MLLDECSEVSVLHPWFLTNIRKVNEAGFQGLSGPSTKISKVGYLEGFFECQACEGCVANILCGADVEDKYDITYEQGKCKIVHMNGKDLIFHRRGKFYVADMTEWIQEQYSFATSGLNDRERLYTSKEVKRAKEAGEFIRKCGYPSENEALHLVMDGNIAEVDITTNDIRRYFEIYGPIPAYVRGKTTKPNKILRSEVQDDLKAQRTNQVLTTDIMYVEKQKFLISIVSPLELVLQSPMSSDTANQMGIGLQTHLNTLRSRGFNVTRVICDPEFSTLQGMFPGVEIDCTGAGDHVGKIDIRIRRLKETNRSVIAGLPYNLPINNVKDLVAYATSRMNVKRTSALSDNVCPRVKFTGRKLNYAREFGISFGDYVEVYNPRVVSNKAVSPRTEPAIALYPVGNSANSWVFLNLNTKDRVVRSWWKLMKMNETIINEMNKIAGIQGIRVAEQEVPERDLTEAARAIPVETHVPIDPQVEEFFDAEEDHDDHHTTTASPVRDEQPMQNQLASQDLINVSEGTVHGGPTAEVATTRMSNRSNKGRPATKMNLHTSVKKGIQQYGDVALHAVAKEFIQLFYEKNALSPVHKRDICRSKRIMRSSMFLTEKYDATGNFERVKARLVADGSIQEESANNHSPTAKHQSIVMCLTDKRNRYAMIVDVTGAYLEADMDEDKYMCLDEYLTQILISIIPSLAKYVCNGKLYCKITKAMYGCKQSAKLWYEHLVNILKEMGFKPNAMDNCVLNGMIDGKFTTIVIYVDDLMVLSGDVKTLETVSSLLKGRFNEVRCKISNDFSYLGMHIEIRNGYVYMSMEKFIGDVLRDYGKLITKVYSVPAIDGLCEIDSKAKPLVGEQKKMFHTIVAKL